MIFFSVGYVPETPWLCVEVNSIGVLGGYPCCGFFANEADAHTWGKANFKRWSVGRVYE